MQDKKEIYKRIKIAGLISYIPIMLAAGPLCGFFLGDYLQKKFKLPYFLLVLCILTGIIIGVREAVRIIKLVSEIDKKG
jgi:F0F1-type ATP synthase assembly protein I